MAVGTGKGAGGCSHDRVEEAVHVTEQGVVVLVVIILGARWDCWGGCLGSLEEL